MIIYVTNMTEMPRSCRECSISDDCHLCAKPGKPYEIKKSCMDKRHKLCPLQEINQ